MTVKVAGVRRIALNLLACLLALFALAIVGCWARSYWVQPPPAVYSDRWVYSAGYAAIYKGEFTLVYYESNPGPARWFQVIQLDTKPLAVAQWMGGSGWNSNWWYTSVRVRLWLICLSFIAFPVLRLGFAIRRRARPPGI